MPSYKVNVKWGKELYKNIEIDTVENPSVFKAKIYELTGVSQERQKVICKGTTVTDSWSNVDLKDGLTLLLMGTRDENVPIEPPVKTNFIEDMSENEIAKVSDLPSGLANLGNTCYLNAVLQCLKTVPELADALKNFNGRSTEGSFNGETLTSAMKHLFQEMENKAVTTPDLFVIVLHQIFPRFAIKDPKGGTWMQQDASECWTELVRMMEQILPSIQKPDFKTKSTHLINQYFSGVFETKFICTESDEAPKISDENFLSLSCFIAQDVKFMVNGIKSQLNEKITKQSDALGRNAVYEKTSTIKRLPAYLTVQFIRFFYKNKGNLNAKILKDVKFPFEFDAYELCSRELQTRLDPIREKIEKKEKVPESFEEDLGSNNSGYYSLRAVLTHMGRSSDSGHYVAWIKHDRLKSWIKCDDKVVTPVSEEEIKKLSGGHGDWHCAYVLLYGPKSVEE